MAVPHFDFPLRVAGGKFVTNEQDSLADVAACAAAVLSCPVGFRVDRPEFGVPDQTFAQGEPDTVAVRAALQRWEPRADSGVTVRAGDTPTSFVIEAAVASTTED